MLDAKQYALTGGDGFLGGHTKLAAHANGATTADIPVGEYLDPDFAVETLESSDVLIHLAGVNRGSDAEVADGNRRFAQQMAAALSACRTSSGCIPKVTLFLFYKTLKSSLSISSSWKMNCSSDL